MQAPTVANGQKILFSSAGANAQSEDLVIDRGFLWHTTTSCLLIFDFFLSTTGNPSLLGSVLGGFSGIIILFATAMVVSSYVPATFKGREARPFYILLSIVGVFSIVLFVASPYATDFAATRMEVQILSFVKDPLHSKADISNEERQLMVKLESLKYDMKRDAFIPTFRRMDYLLMMENGEKYLLIMEMSWNGTPSISLHRQ